MPSKTNQKKTDTVWFLLYVELKKINRNRDINLENKYVVPNGEERSRWGRLRGTNFQLQNKMSHGDEMYRVGNIVNNNVVFVYDDR